MKRKPEAGEVVVLRLSGYEDISSFTSRLEVLMESGLACFVLDLEHVALVSSKLIGQLVKTQRALEERGGALVLARPSDFIRKTLGVLGLEGMFLYFADPGEAVRHLCPQDS